MLGAEFSNEKAVFMLSQCPVIVFLFSRRKRIVTQKLQIFVHD